MSVTITLAELVRLKACKRQRELFQARFGDSATFHTKEAFREACGVNRDFDYRWAAGWLLPLSKQEEFGRQCALLREEFDRQCAPLREEFDRQCAPLREEFDRQCAPLWEEFDRQCAPLWEEYDRQCALLREEFDRQRALLFADLFWGLKNGNWAYRNEDQCA